MRIIDTHAHWYPQPWIDLLERDADGLLGEVRVRAGAGLARMARIIREAGIKAD